MSESSGEEVVSLVELDKVHSLISDCIISCGPVWSDAYLLFPENLGVKRRRQTIDSKGSDQICRAGPKEMADGS